MFWDFIEQNGEFEKLNVTIICLCMFLCVCEFTEKGGDCGGWC
jgi:hypothetical protein